MLFIPRHMILAGYYGFMLDIPMSIHVLECPSICLSIFSILDAFFTWVNINGFSQNLVCALILWRSDLGLLMGKFVTDSYYAVTHPYLCFQMITLNIKVNGFSPNLVCTFMLWRPGLGLLMGNFYQFLTELSAHHMIISAWVLSFHVFIMQLCFFHYFMASSVDWFFSSSLIWVCTVCICHFVRYFWSTQFVYAISSENFGKSNFRTSTVYPVSKGKIKKKNPILLSEK